MTAAKSSTILVVTAAIGVLANLLDGRLRLVTPSWQMLIAGVLPFAVAATFVVVARRSGWRRLGFALVPLAALLLLGEIVLRMSFPLAGRDLKQILAPAAVGRRAGGELFEPHHYALFTLGEIGDAPGGRRHNRLGLRDHRRLEPDPRAARIVFVGGSTTYTIGVEDNREVFTARLEELLAAHYEELLGERRIEVVNAGMPQATSAENLIRLAFLIPEVDPDLVVIQHGINDGWPRAAGGLAPDYGNYRNSWTRPPVFPPGRSIAASLSLETRFHSMAAAYILNRSGLAPLLSVEHYVTLPGTRYSARNLQRNGSEYFERNTRSMVALAREMGAEVVLATIAIDPQRAGILRRFVPEHNAVLRRIARDQGTLLYDFASEMRTDAEHMPDGRHVSKLGSDLKAELWFDFLVAHDVVPMLAAAASAE